MPWLPSCFRFYDNVIKNSKISSFHFLFALFLVHVMGVWGCVHRTCTCVSPHIWTWGFSDSWSSDNHLIQNFSFKDEITPWNFHQRQKAQKFFSSSLHASLHRDRGFNVWKIIIFVGFICGTWEPGNIELNLTIHHLCLCRRPTPAITQSDVCVCVCKCICTYMYMYLKQYIRATMLQRFLELYSTLS